MPAHERAHLRGRHAALVAVTAALRRACPRVPLFARAHVEVAQLVEVLADEPDSSRRAWRLVDPPPRLSAARVAGIWLALTVAVALPVAAAVVPITVSIDLSNHQHVSGHDWTPI